MKFAARAQAAPFELAIALLLVVSGVRFLIDNAALQASQIGETLPVPELWAAGYALAGGLLALGILAPHVKTEAAGLCLTASLVAINALAILYAYGVSWDMVAGLIFYASLILAALGRLLLLLEPRPLVYSEAIEVDDDGH